MENNGIKHPISINTEIEFKANGFFIQGAIKSSVSNGFKYVYVVTGGRGGEYTVTENEVMAILKNKPKEIKLSDVKKDAVKEFSEENKDMVNHPTHYGGADNPMEVIKIIDHYQLPFSLGNTIKYILRADKKANKLEDLKKAAWYLQHEITKLENV